MNSSRFRNIVRTVLSATGTIGIARKIRARLRQRSAPIVSPSSFPSASPAIENKDSNQYAARVSAEIATFENNNFVHDLPAIFHYWSNKYLLPTIKPFGFLHPDDFFIKQLASALDVDRTKHASFISIGAGNCDTEVRIASGLAALGYDKFSIECLDLNSAMLSRGQELAKREGMEQHIIPVKGDFNTWQPDKRYRAVLANQSLHHVLNLEHLFDSILAAIKAENGTLITSDMIGRNGHQRWPEALAIVEEFWAELPTKYKLNHQLGRQENEFVNWDCAIDGFEGIRAQDIMPLLRERFHFDLFIPFSNVIAPFIDRGFGHNFDIHSDWDRSFIDRVHARDQIEINRGHITPTQMFAVLSADWSRPTAHIEGLSPEFCTRKNDQ
jgi:hypothetical protein